MPAPGDGVVAAVRTVQPVLELRIPSELALVELDAIDRGTIDPGRRRPSRRPR